jgi:hypothetical protein
MSLSGGERRMNQKDRNAWLWMIFAIIVLFILGDLVAHVSFDSPADNYSFDSHGYVHILSILLDDVMPVLILSGVIIAGIVFVLVKGPS